LILINASLAVNPVLMHIPTFLVFWNLGSCVAGGIFWKETESFTAVNWLLYVLGASPRAFPTCARQVRGRVTPLRAQASCCLSRASSPPTSRRRGNSSSSSSSSSGRRRAASRHQGSRGGGARAAPSPRRRAAASCTISRSRCSRAERRRGAPHAARVPLTARCARSPARRRAARARLEALLCQGRGSRAWRRRSRLPLALAVWQAVRTVGSDGRGDTLAAVQQRGGHRGEWCLGVSVCKQSLWVVAPARLTTGKEARDSRAGKECVGAGAAPERVQHVLGALEPVVDDLKKVLGQLCVRPVPARPAPAPPQHSTLCGARARRGGRCWARDPARSMVANSALGNSSSVRARYSSLMYGERPPRTKRHGPSYRAPGFCQLVRCEGRGVSD
jgi:hypothetical protein